MNAHVMYVSFPRPAGSRYEGCDETRVRVLWERDSDERVVIDSVEISEEGDPDNDTLLPLTPALKEEIEAELEPLPDEPWEPDWDALYEDYEFRKRDRES